MIKYKVRKGDILLFFGIVLGALLLFLLQGRGGVGGYAVVYVGSDVYGAYPLQVDRDVEIAREDGRVNRVHIENGTVSMARSTCKNQICVRHAAISGQDAWIVCLPNEVSITVSKEAAQR